MNRAAPADPFAWVGHTIDGKFRIDEVIGEGGFGVVYRAFHLGFSDTIALKCLKLPPSLPASERDRFYDSFVTEGRLLHKLSRSTPGIVQALDVGAAVSPAGTWTPYLVLEWLHGTPFDKYLSARAAGAEGPMPLADAVALLDSAAQAVAKAHAQGVAHRDIKPANLFISDAGSKPMMKVLDFGIAKVLTDTQSVTRALEATGGSASIFTPHYGAPEQYNRRFGATGPWTDVFAFALLLVEVVSGRQALEGDDMTQLYIAATDPWHRPTLRARGIEVTDAVENVLLRALHVEPRGRYASAGVFWDALKAAMQGVDPGRVASPEPRAQAPSGEISEAGPPRDPATPATEKSEGNPGTTALQAARSLPEPSLAGRSKPPVRALLVGVAAALAMAGAGAGAVWKLRRDRGSLLQVASPRLANHVASAISFRPLPDEMVLVLAGSFMMGHATAGKTERPAHRVTISRSFYIDRTEVTAADYARCMESKRCTPSHVHGPTVDEAEAAKFAPLCNASDPARAQHPINCVDKSQAATYCDFAGKRLPTEAEWEYAARGNSDERLYPWGNPAPGCDKGMFARSRADGCPRRPPGTMPVGSFPSNASPFGALDMAGNVWEWVADGWDPAAYQKGAVTDPIAPPAEHGVLRGGSWDYSTSVAKSTYRLAFHSTLGHVSTGLRCARTAD